MSVFFCFLPPRVWCYYCGRRSIAAAGNTEEVGIGATTTTAATDRLL